MPVSPNDKPTIYCEVENSLELSSAKAGIHDSFVFWDALPSREWLRIEFYGNFPIQLALGLKATYINRKLLYVKTPDQFCCSFTIYFLL